MCATASHVATEEVVNAVPTDPRTSAYAVMDSEGISVRVSRTPVDPIPACTVDCV